MSQEFEIVSPERLQSTTDIQWDLCFICQICSGNEDLISPITKAGSVILIIF